MLASLSEDRSADTACTAELPEADLTASAAFCAFSAFLQPMIRTDAAGSVHAEMRFHACQCSCVNAAEARLDCVVISCAVVMQIGSQTPPAMHDDYGACLCKLHCGVLADAVTRTCAHADVGCDLAMSSERCTACIARDSNRRALDAAAPQLQRRQQVRAVEQ